jgi:hypothetical protein
MDRLEKAPDADVFRLERYPFGRAGHLISVKLRPGGRW